MPVSDGAIAWHAPPIAVGNAAGICNFPAKFYFVAVDSLFLSWRLQAARIETRHLNFFLRLCFMKQNKGSSLRQRGNGGNLELEGRNG